MWEYGIYLWVIIWKSQWNASYKRKHLSTNTELRSEHLIFFKCYELKTFIGVFL
jgi:hypothetical protein